MNATPTIEQIEFIEEISLYHWSMLQQTQIDDPEFIEDVDILTPAGARIFLLEGGFLELIGATAVIWKSYCEDFEQARNWDWEFIYEETLLRIQDWMDHPEEMMRTFNVGPEVQPAQ